MKREDFELIKRAMFDFKLRGDFTDDLKSIECDDSFFENLKKVIDIHNEKEEVRKRKEEDKIILQQKTKDFLSVLGINFHMSSHTGETLIVVKGADLYEMFNNKIKLKEFMTKLKLKNFW